MKKFLLKTILCSFFLIFLISECSSWGFFAHKKINQLAVFTLPPEMAVFYKKNLDYITERAVAPDKRRYIVKEEGARHFIDLDFYCDSLSLNLPLSWKSIDSLVPEELRLKHGILPWHLFLMKIRLTEAFKRLDANAILKLSAEMGHYLADANVPLHTTVNYNGQLTHQHGIHGLWETRLPELYFEKYQFWVGKAEYINSVYESVWNTIFQSHTEVDSVLYLEKKISLNFPEDQKYSFEERGGTMVKVYSREYCNKYNETLNDQIERRMKNSVKMIGSLWFTCWVDAGKPDLRELAGFKVEDLSPVNENIPDVAHDCSGH